MQKLGERNTGYFDLRKLDGTKVHASAKAKGLKLLETANTFLIETLKRGTLLHILMNVVSATPAPPRRFMNKCYIANK